MIGKTLEEYEATLPKTANQYDPDGEIDDEAMRRGMLPYTLITGVSHSKHFCNSDSIISSLLRSLLGMASHNRNASSQELSTVLDSLSRLAELEQRISGLEKENKYDKMVEREHPGGANQRTSIEFRKKRNVPEASGPIGISYQIRPKPTAGGPWNVQMPVGGGTNAARARQQNNNNNAMFEASAGDFYDDGAGGGTFITAGMDNGSVANDRYGCAFHSSVLW